MLVAAVGQGSIADSVDMKRRLKRHQLGQQVLWPLDDWIHGMDNPAAAASSYDTYQDLLGTRPNSWCGISNEVIHVFGQVLALCRSVVYLEQEDSSPPSDILIALELQRDLLAMDFDALVLMEEAQGFAVETRDINTPVSHLVWTAEAFRQAALLQLDLTFKNLGRITEEPPVSQEFLLAGVLPNGTAGDTSSEEQRRGEMLLRSTLRLVRVLEQIPADSGSRSIHPMLHLSAAAGLRFITGVDSQDSAYPATGNLGQGNDPLGFLLSENSAIPMTTSPLFNTVPSELDMLNVGFQSMTGSAAHVINPQSTFEIVKARQFVWTRLQNLQQSLPHGASNSMSHLVKNIWLEFDQWQPGDAEVHWLKVWRKCGLGFTLW